MPQIVNMHLPDVIFTDYINMYFESVKITSAYLYVNLKIYGDI